MVIGIESLKSITERIRRTRDTLGISQKKLAKLVGLSQSEIARIERDPEKLNPGYATVAAIADALDSYSAGYVGTDTLSRPVSDIMHRKVVYVRPKDRIEIAIELMKSRDFSQLPVLNNRKASIGTVYQKKILFMAAESYGGRKGMLVEDIMDGALPQVDEETQIKKIKPILENFDALLVSDNNRIVGIVTVYDFLRLV